MAKTAADITEPLPPVRQKSIKWGLAGIVLVLFGLLVSIGLGAIWISPSVVLESFVSFQEGQIEHQLIREVRLPRALTGALIGAALAVAGTIMQGITRNPLADPSIIGITHGAGLAIAIALAFISSGSYWVLLAWSFCCWRNPRTLFFNAF